jgi:FHS family L-fucose permease-like MFS transporter
MRIVMLVQFSFFSAFLLFAGPSAKLIAHVGYKRTMVAGLLTMSVGALLFIPAANVPSFMFFMCALMVFGGGYHCASGGWKSVCLGLGSCANGFQQVDSLSGLQLAGSTIRADIRGLTDAERAPGSQHDWHHERIGTAKPIGWSRRRK